MVVFNSGYHLMAQVRDDLGFDHPIPDFMRTFDRNPSQKPGQVGVMQTVKEVL